MIGEVAPRNFFGPSIFGFMIAITSMANAGLGTAGQQFLRLDTSARNEAMGGATSALPEGSGALESNPAGLAFFEEPELGASYVALFQDTDLSSVNLALPLQSCGLAADFLWLGGSNFNSTADASQVEPSEQDYAGSLGWGFLGPWGLAMGLSAKGYYSNLGPASSEGGAVDAGLILRPWDQGLSLSIAGKNLGVGSAYEQVSDPLPMTILGGVAWRFGEDGERGGISVDLNSALGSPLQVGVGAEWKVVDSLALRAGWKTYSGGPAFSADLSGLTAGLGFSLGNWGLDYAALPNTTLGLTQRLSLLWRFGRGLQEIPWRELFWAPPTLLGSDGSRDLRLKPRLFALQQEIKSWNIELRDKKGILLASQTGTAPFPEVIHFLGSDAEALGNSRDISFKFVMQTRPGRTLSSSGKVAINASTESLELAQPAMLQYRSKVGGLLLKTQFNDHLANVKSWKLQIVDDQGRVLKTVSGQGILPRELEWNGRTDAGGAVNLSKAFRFNLEVTKKDGGTIGNSGSIAASLAPRELLVSAPQFNARMGILSFSPRSAGMAIGVKEWHLDIKAPDGRILKTITGKGELPRVIEWNPGNIREVNGSENRLGIARHVQFLLETKDSSGRSQTISDVVQLGESAADKEGKFTVRKGKEALLLPLLGLCSSDPDQAEPFTLGYNGDKNIRRWKIEANNVSGVNLREWHGEGEVPETLIWDGKLENGKQADCGGKCGFTLSADTGRGDWHSVEKVNLVLRAFSVESSKWKVQKRHAAWFADASSSIQPEMVELLKGLGEDIKHAKGATIILQGHASQTGGDEINRELADQRAAAVKKFLVNECGVDAKRLQLRGFSNRLLLESGEGEEAEKLNRRVDVLVIEPIK
jgi:outer membrane protein OmpA-like peptidoglycan-associated protein